MYLPIFSNEHTKHYMSFVILLGGPGFKFYDNLKMIKNGKICGKWILGISLSVENRISQGTRVCTTNFQKGIDGGKFWNPGNYL